MGCTKDRNIKLLRFFCAKKLSFCPKKPFLKPYCFPLVALPIFYERVVISIFNLISLIRRSVLFFVSQKQPGGCNAFPGDIPYGMGVLFQHYKDRKTRLCLSLKRYSTHSILNNPLAN